MTAVSVHAHAVQAHAHPVMDHFLKLGLLVRRERLVERGHRLGMRRDLLGREIANGIGVLINRRRVIVLDGQEQVLMRRAHLLMGGFLVAHNLGKKGGGLLLLLGRERQHFGQVVHVVLDHLRGIRRLPVLRRDQYAHHGKDCDHFQEVCSHWGSSSPLLLCVD
jgi:hypothetical protein